MGTRVPTRWPIRSAHVCVTPKVRTHSFAAKLLRSPLAATGAMLKKRTLANLDNERPTWLDRAHRALDESRFAAYGWPPSMTGDVILAARLAVAPSGPEGEPVSEDDDG